MFRKYSGGSRDDKIVPVEHTNIQDPDFSVRVIKCSFCGVLLSINANPIRNKETICFHI